MKHFIILSLLCFAVAGCGGTSQPDGFPTGLVPVEITLLHQGKPLEQAGVLLVSDSQVKYRLAGSTDSAGIVKLETAINNYSKPGVPAGTYPVLVLVQIQSTLADLTPDEVSSKSDAEIEQHQKKQDAEKASLRKQIGVPLEWENAAKTPLKLTIPAGGGKFTIDVTDVKTFVQ
ncbi:MAG: hypothetical protein LBN39_09970 [Planctomycetaceae bacterium]|jgi:hypothetical protein|nr:hypothetical protein [Planctomycetaceae bacterium]